MNTNFNSTIWFWSFLIVIVALFGLGIYLLLLYLFDISSKRKSKNFYKLTSSANSSLGSLGAQVAMWGKKLEKHPLIIKMINPYKREKMVNEFNILRINKTPEEHLATSLISGAIFVPVGLLILILGLLIGFALIGVIGFLFLTLLGVLVGLLEYNSVDSMINKRRDSIERELPAFISFVENTLKNDRDVIKMLSSYITDDDSPLISELKILLIDLRTGDYEYAFNRFSMRTNSSSVSEISRGLVSAMRGDDVQTYFEMLSFNLWEAEKRRLEKEALKRPKRVKFLTFFLYAGMMILYIVVFGTVILEGLGNIF